MPSFGQNLSAQRARRNALIDVERNRRIRLGFSFEGKPYDYDEGSQARIAGASTAALSARIAGSQPGDLRWRWGDRDFVWIAADNSLTPMDAHKCFDFGEAALDHEAAHIFAAKTLKNMDDLPEDWKSDLYWPT